MEKEFIPYKQALALKELGFDEPCFRKYDEEGVLIRTSVENQEHRGNHISVYVSLIDATNSLLGVIMTNLTRLEQFTDK